MTLVNQDITWEVDSFVEVDEDIRGSDFHRKRTKPTVKIQGNVSMNIQSSGKGGIYNALINIERIQVSEFELELIYEQENERDKKEFYTVPAVNIDAGANINTIPQRLIEYEMDEGFFNPVRIDLYWSDDTQEYSVEDIEWGGAY